MDVSEFISRYKNYPILFVGTGLSLRYLQESYTWDRLLCRVAKEIDASGRYYLDLKAENMQNDSTYDYAEIATQIEMAFTEKLKKSDEGFEDINTIFYDNVEHGIKVSRFKIFIAKLLQKLTFKVDVQDEISELKKAKRNISSVITTNYDCMIENILEFSPLIGNNIILSNPYGSVYKIHGCVSRPDKIIMTKNDYESFNIRYELLRAELISLFVHNPIIFMGYNVGDKNIKDILRTIFSYVECDSVLAKKVRDNFLLVEYDSGSCNTDVVEHDIDIEKIGTITINKLKTDNFKVIYSTLSNLVLPVSVMDVRKVQSIVKEIYTGGKIKVSIEENIDELSNSDKILAIGSKEKLKAVFYTVADIIVNYFQIIDDVDIQTIKLIDKQKIQSSQYFPIHVFACMCPNLKKLDLLKKQQKNKIDKLLCNSKVGVNGSHITPRQVFEDDTIRDTYKVLEIVKSIMSGKMDLKEVELYLKSIEDKKSTDYKKILCAYDIKYSERFEVMKDGRI